MSEPSNEPLSALRTPKPVIGIIGGIGSGKTSVARLFVGHGGFLIQGDVLGHEALRQPPIRNQVVTRFGREILDANGEVVRRKLGERVFADERERRALEALVFPWIERRCRELIAQGQADSNVRFIVLDAAIMLEAGWNTVCDRIVYVDVPRPVRLARLAQRGWTEAQVVAREQAQWPLVEKVRRADAAIDNGGDEKSTAIQVEQLLREWNLLTESGKC